MKLEDNFTGSHCFGESRFTLRLNAAKITDYYIKKHFKQKYSELNFLQKTQWKHISISFRSRTRRLERLPVFKYNVLEQKSGFTLGLNAAKSTDYIKKYFK